jgi:FkbM family methyltransferase
MSTEHIFSIPPLRRAYSEDLSRFGIDKVAYWFEMERPGYGDRNFSETLDIYLNQYNWKHLIRKGTTVVDIGTFSGDTTITMMATSGYCVLGVECNPTVYPYAKFAAEMNRHLGKIIIAPEAVTTQNTVVKFTDHNNQMVNGGLVNSEWGVGENANNVVVQGITLTDLLHKYLSQEEISRIDFIKTDTEGHDFSILESSAEIIDQLRPTIFAEWFNYFDAPKINRMFNIINKLDYVALHPLTYEPAVPDNRSDDLLLIHKTKIDNFLKEIK